MSRRPERWYIVHYEWYRTDGGSQVLCRSRATWSAYAHDEEEAARHAEAILLPALQNNEVLSIISAEEFAMDDDEDEFEGIEGEKGDPFKGIIAGALLSLLAWMLVGLMVYVVGRLLI